MSKMKVKDVDTGFEYIVYDILFDRNGIHFLVFYDNRGWVYIKADNFVPVEVE